MTISQKTFKPALPSPRREPIPTAGLPCGGAELRLIARKLNRRPALLYGVKTGTRIDTGGWWFRCNVYAYTTRDELILLAWGRDEYVEVIALHELSTSTYNPLTGEVVLGPGCGKRVSKLKLNPLAGYQLLAQILRSDEESSE
ncbi:MAG: hypothetical protein ACLFVU_03395 [Phycisphaerae bacterium]